VYFENKIDIMQPKQIWANLAVKDVEATRKFYTTLGFTSNEGHNMNDVLTSFKFGEHGFVINFFSHQHFADMAKGGSPNLSGINEVMFTLWAESHEEANGWAVEISKAGGILLSQPKAFGRDYYGFEFTDPDGHKWNVFNM
jgi:predicted lactoylglutathione lyase